jgi:hypothetical protein
MSRRRNQKSTNPKLDQFPDDFDVDFFHQTVIDRDDKVSILRNMVYKKIKNKIIERVAEYTDDNITLEDKFVVDFELTGYQVFQWAVIREELLNLQFDSYFKFENDKPISFHVDVVRDIDIFETLKEKNEREKREECDSSDCEHSDNDE